MPHTFTESTPLQIGKWCAYALILLTPGSFFVLAVMGLIKLCGVRFSSRPSSFHRNPAADR
jgi:hypothetical protein